MNSMKRERTARTLLYLLARDARIEIPTKKQNAFTWSLLINDGSIDGFYSRLLALLMFLSALLSMFFASNTALLVVPLHTIDNFSSSSNNNNNCYNENAGDETPLTVFVHGLDSSSKTWTDTMTAMSPEMPCLAVDQRGSGYSPLGDPRSFSQDALIGDLHDIITTECNGNAAGDEKKKVVLVGHSLGGRIVLGYAAVHPERIASVVIEDMDIEPRTPNKHGVVRLNPYEGVFDRQRESREAIIEALRAVGYPAEFVEKGLATGRIEPSPFTKQGNDDGTTITTSTPYWSHINPDFRKLCYEHVLSTARGKDDCRAIAALLRKGKFNFPLHVMVAGTEGTVCLEESVKEMEAILGDRLSVHRFPTAGHSIHSTDVDGFRETLRSIVKSTKKGDS